MTWIIPSDREGHWNPAGLSLKSPRFLSNRWGPPQNAPYRIFTIGRGLPSTISMNEGRFVAVGHSKAAVLYSAMTGLCAENLEDSPCGDSGNANRGTATA